MAREVVTASTSAPTITSQCSQCGSMVPHQCEDNTIVIVRTLEDKKPRWWKSDREKVDIEVCFRCGQVFKTWRKQSGSAYCRTRVSPPEEESESFRFTNEEAKQYLAQAQEVLNGLPTGLMSIGRERRWS